MMLLHIKKRGASLRGSVEAGHGISLFQLQFSLTPPNSIDSLF